TAKPPGWEAPPGGPRPMRFEQDPIYAEIGETLKPFARALTGRDDAEFRDPFVSKALADVGRSAYLITHPLGGCVISDAADHGVVDRFGRVYHRGRQGDRPFHDGLYVADASVIPSALGVNPSLTISALALRAAEKVIAELDGY